MLWLWLVVGLIVGFVIAWWWVNRNLAPLIEAAEADRDVQAERASVAEGALATATTELDSAQKNVESLTVDREETAAERDSLKTELEEASRALVEAQREGDAALAALQRAEEGQATSLAELKAVQGAVADAETKYQKVTDEFVEVRRQARAAESERDQVLSDRDGSMEDLRRRTGEAEAVASGAQAEISRLSKALSVSEARVEALGESSDEAARAHEELGAVRTQLAQAQARLAEAEPARVERSAEATEHESTPEDGADADETSHETGSHASSLADSPSADPQSRLVTEGESIDPEDLPTGTTETNISSSGDAIVVESESDAVDDGAEAETVEIPSTRPQTEDADVEPNRPPDPASDSDLASTMPDGAGQVETAAPSEESLSSPDVEPDDIRQVKGIGPKFEGLLHDRQITSYQQIAAISDDAALEEYLDTFSGRIEREDWRGQAKALHLAKYGEAL